MVTKAPFYNAGLTKSLLRCLMALFSVLLLYFMWFWGAFDLKTACIACLVLLLGAPTVFFGALYLLRFFGSEKLNWEEHSHLKKLYLELLLKNAGPRLKVRIEKRETEPLYFWIERIFTLHDCETLFVTESWLKMDIAEQEKAFRNLWQEIESGQRRHKVLRTFQIAFWVGLLWPFEIFFALTRELQEFMGVRELPHLSFWLQKLAHTLRSFLLGLRPKNPETLFVSYENSQKKNYRYPLTWDSILWGPWFVNCSQSQHPLWHLWGFEVMDSSRKKRMSET